MEREILDQKLKQILKNSRSTILSEKKVIFTSGIFTNMPKRSEKIFIISYLGGEDILSGKFYMKIRCDFSRGENLCIHDKIIFVTLSYSVTILQFLPISGLNQIDGYT